MQNFITLHQQRIQHFLEKLLTDFNGAPQPLFAAMRYGVLNGGKRIRPLLVYATGASFNIPAERLDNLAASVELIHAYSLIHDDLPAMDNADLRRGQPTCHKIFGEGNAILIGDCLLPLAFEIIADCPQLTAVQKIQCGKILAQAAGAKGMAGGQFLDLAAEHTQMTLAELYRLHQMKTGALIKASIHLAAIVAEVENMTALLLFADKLGLAYQLQDDILDVEAATADLGKTQGTDAALNKPTFPALLGLEKAKAVLQDLIAEIQSSLSQLNPPNPQLIEFTQTLLQREY